MAREASPPKSVLDWLATPPLNEAATFAACVAAVPVKRPSATMEMTRSFIARLSKKMKYDAPLIDLLLRNFISKQRVAPPSSII